MCSFHSRRPIFLCYAQAFWDSQKPQVNQWGLSWGNKEQKSDVEGADRWREAAREATRPTPGWVTLGCVPGLGACPANQDDDLPYSLFMCLDLIKVVS